MSGTRRTLRLLIPILALCLGSGVPSAAQGLRPALEHGFASLAQWPLPANISGDKYTLSGRVVNSITGEGIARALVEIGNVVAVLTDGDGHFSFEGLARGSYPVSARKPGYFNRDEDASHSLHLRGTIYASGSGGTGYTYVQVGPETRSLTIALVPEAVISGRITDSDGMPVQRLAVRCLRSVVVEGRSEWQQTSDKATDEDGEYRIAGLLPGTYLVVAGPSSFPSIAAMTKTGRQESGFGAAFYPSLDDGGATGGIRISAGQKVEADIQVDAEPFYSITGALNAPPGSGVWIRMFPRDGILPERGQGIQRSDNNTFNIHVVPPGDYDIEAGEQVEGRLWQANFPLHVAGDISGLQITLQPAMTIPVTTMVERTKPEAPISTSSDGVRFYQPVQVMLRSTDARPDHHSYWASFKRSRRNEDDRSLTLHDVVPGTYALNATTSGDLYVASAQYGSVDLLRDKLIVSASVSADSVDILLRDDGATVKGTITKNGKPAHGVLLIVPDSGSPYVALRQATGTFTLRQLRPGSYSILAFDDISNLEYAVPDALDTFLSHAAHVDLTANQETTVSLELIQRDGE